MFDGLDRADLLGMAQDELKNLKSESRRAAGQMLMEEMLGPACMSLEQVGDMDVMGGAINAMLVSAISLIATRTGRDLLDNTPSGGAFFPKEIEAHIVKELDKYLKPVA